jgi:hypothetical protein
VPGLFPIVPHDTPAFLRRFVLSEVLGPPLGRLPTGRRDARAPAAGGPARPAPTEAPPATDEPRPDRTDAP